MRKADSLRQHLAAYLPDLATHPDRLQIFVEGGEVAARKSRSLSFAYRYSLKALITDFAGDASPVMVAVLAWIEREQPELLTASDDVPFRFEAELLDGDLVDLELTIALSENVLVTPRADGSGFDIEPLPEPIAQGADLGAWPDEGEGFAVLLEAYGLSELLAKSANAPAP